MNDVLLRGRVPLFERQSETHFLVRLHCPAALIFAAVLACCSPVAARPQSLPTASRAADLQLGGGFVIARSAYNFTPIHLYGVSIYADLAIRPHWGAEFDFHHTKASEDSTIYERTYELGPRFFLTRGAVTPYAKVLYGRGVYNFRNNTANVAYNMYTFGGGMDFAVTRSVNVRGDYEYQNWMGFPLGTLHPSVGTIGVAWHFHE
jgi:opacity protein-like surface antigen